MKHIFALFIFFALGATELTAKRVSSRKSKMRKNGPRNTRKVSSRKKKTLGKKTGKKPKGRGKSKNRALSQSSGGTSSTAGTPSSVPSISVSAPRDAQLIGDGVGGGSTPPITNASRAEDQNASRAEDQNAFGEDHEGQAEYSPGSGGIQTRTRPPLLLADKPSLTNGVLDIFLGKGGSSNLDVYFQNVVNKLEVAGDLGKYIKDRYDRLLEFKTKTTKDLIVPGECERQIAKVRFFSSVFDAACKTLDQPKTILTNLINALVHADSLMGASSSTIDSATQAAKNLSAKDLTDCLTQIAKSASSDVVDILFALDVVDNNPLKSYVLVPSVILTKGTGSDPRAPVVFKAIVLFPGVLRHILKLFIPAALLDLNAQDGQDPNFTVSQLRASGLKKSLLTREARIEMMKKEMSVEIQIEEWLSSQKLENNSGGGLNCGAFSLFSPETHLVDIACGIAWDEEIFKTFMEQTYDKDRSNFPTKQGFIDFCKNDFLEHWKEYLKKHTSDQMNDTRMTDTTRKSGHNVSIFNLKTQDMIDALNKLIAFFESQTNTQSTNPTDLNAWINKYTTYLDATKSSDVQSEKLNLRRAFVLAPDKNIQKYDRNGRSSTKKLRNQEGIFFMAETNTRVELGDFNSYLLTAAKLAKANILLRANENSRDRWSFVPNIDQTEKTVVLFLRPGHFQHYAPKDKNPKYQNFNLGAQTSPHALYNIKDIPFARYYIQTQYDECNDQTTPAAKAMGAILSEWPA